MFAKLLSNQLGAFAADPTFGYACRALPAEAMLAILQKYTPTKAQTWLQWTAKGKAREQDRFAAVAMSFGRDFVCSLPESD
jgi:hypothetical protein